MPVLAISHQLILFWGSYRGGPPFSCLTSFVCPLCTAQSIGQSRSSSLFQALGAIQCVFPGPRFGICMAGCRAENPAAALVGCQRQSLQDQQPQRGHSKVQDKGHQHPKPWPHICLFTLTSLSDQTNTSTSPAVNTVLPEKEAEKTNLKS